MQMSEVKEDIQAIAFQIILHAGDARSSAMEAIQLAQAGNYDEAEAKIEAASQSFTEAHHVQTNLLQKEARGEMTDPTLIMIHAQDHLMTAMVVKDMAHVMIDLYRQLKG